MILHRPLVWAKNCMCVCVSKEQLWLGKGERRCAPGQGSPYIAGLELLESSMSSKALQLHRNCCGGFKEPSCKGWECLPEQFSGCTETGTSLLSNPFPPPLYFSSFPKASSPRLIKIFQCFPNLK